MQEDESGIKDHELINSSAKASIVYLGKQYKKHSTERVISPHVSFPSFWQ